MRSRPDCGPVRLVATEGRVLLGGRVPEPAELPSELREALQEWAEVAATVVSLGAPADRELLRRRGRQLAARLATHRGGPVEYVDPVTGAIEAVPHAPLPPGAPDLEPPDAHAAPAVEPTPWATGLTITATFGIVVAIADITLSRAFADAFGLLWLPANLLVSAGVAPALWLLRHTPFWRWPAYGAVVGIVAAWTALLVGLLR